MNNYESKKHKISTAFIDTQNNVNQLDELKLKEIKINQVIDFNTLDVGKNISILNSEWITLTQSEFYGDYIYYGYYLLKINVNNFPVKLIPYLKHVLLYDGIQSPFELHHSHFINVNGFNKTQDTFSQKLSISICYSISNYQFQAHPWENSTMKIKLLVAVVNPKHFR